MVRAKPCTDDLADSPLELRERATEEDRPAVLSIGGASLLLPTRLESVLLMNDTFSLTFFGLPAGRVFVELFVDVLEGALETDGALETVLEEPPEEALEEALWDGRRAGRTGAGTASTVTVPTTVAGLLLAEVGMITPARPRRARENFGALGSKSEPGGAAPPRPGPAMLPYMDCGAASPHSPRPRGAGAAGMGGGGMSPHSPPPFPPSDIGRLPFNAFWLRERLSRRVWPRGGPELGPAALLFSSGFVSYMLVERTLFFCATLLSLELLSCTV